MNSNPLNKTCERCFDTGIWLTPAGTIAVCPRIQMSYAHAEQSPAVKLLERAVRRLQEEKKEIPSQIFELAQMLTVFTSPQPASAKFLAARLFAATNLSDELKRRKLSAFIETLRSVWLLPVGSQKSEPCGYWIITDLNDYKAWFNRTKSGPVTQLTTLHRNAKANFPVFAEQIELEFFSDVQEVANA